MKKAIAITLVVVILGIIDLPSKAKAGGASEGAAIGAAAGLVTVIILWVVKSIERGSTADEEELWSGEEGEASSLST